MASAPTASTQTTFWAAAPYAASALTAGIAGAGIAVASSFTVIQLAGVVTAFVGAYVFGATLACGFKYSDDVQGFNEHIREYIITGAGTAVARIIEQVASETLRSMVDSCLGRRPSYR